jgi:hypothetical protein
MFVSISKHKKFYNSEESNDDTLKPIAPEEGKNTPVEENRDNNDEKITQQQHFC